VSDERHFLGEWRQIRPDPSPARIVIAFAPDHQLTYTIESPDSMRVALRWRVAGTTLITSASDGSEERISGFRFRSPTMLVLERDREQYVYRRTSAGE
jgi:hypothetical protein